MRSRLRSSRSAVLVLAALAVVLAVTAGLLWLTDRRTHDVKVQGQPMTDAQAAGQVLASARQIVEAARLQEVTGGYAFVSCKNENEPPYQAAVYLNFGLPQNNSVKYLLSLIHI